MKIFGTSVRCKLRAGALVPVANVGVAMIIAFAGVALSVASAQTTNPQPPSEPGDPSEIDLEKLKAMLKEKGIDLGNKPGDGDQPEGKQPGAGAGGDDGKPPAPNAKSAAEVQSEEAIARFQQLLQRRPFHGPAFTALVNHYVERGKLKELIAEYTARVAALPDDVATRVVLARLLLRAGDGAAAATMLEKIGTLPPELARQSGDLLVLKSEVFQKTGDDEGAERVLKEALGAAQGAPEKLRLGEALADLYVRTNRPEDAAKSLNALAGEFPDNYIQQKHIAAALAQRNLHEAAVERYKAIAATLKDDVERRTEVLRDMGSSLEKLKKNEEAIAVYIEAVGLLASDHWMVPELHERIVGLYRAGNKLDDLAAYCVAQIARAPEQTAVRVLLADVKAALGKPDEGKAVLAEAVGLFPKDAGLSQKRVEFLERVGDVEGVAAEYQRAIGQRGDDSELYIAYGQFLANNKKMEGARAQWQHVLETRLADPTLAVRLGGLFEAYELQDDAEAAYERAIKVAPKQPDAYTALSRLWVSRGDAEKAVATLTRMGDANPDDGAVQAARAQALRSLGRIEDALKAATRACELLPSDVRLLQAKAELLVQNGRLEEALEVRRSLIDKIVNPAQQAEAIGTLVSMHASADRLAALKVNEQKRLAAKPDDAVTLLLLARVADAERDFPAARGHLDALLKVDPGNETGLGQMAKLQDATGDMDGAVETYTRLAQRYPARARQFYEAIVELKLRYNDRAGAIATLEKLAGNDATSAPTLSAVADQLVRMGDPERSLPYFEKALVAQGDRHETRLSYGKALVEAGRLEDAMAAFRIVAIQRSDTDRAAEALAKLRDTAVQLGHLEELIDELHRQVEADPKNTLVARALAQLLVGEMEYGRALDLLDLIQKQNPRNAELALGRADVLRRLARYDEAIDAYQKVLRFPQVDRDYVLGELGKAYFESGQVDQARRLWKQVQNKLYAGSLLKNNGILEEAIHSFEEGIRLKPDEYALHRNLIEALESAGRTPEALAAARRLLDLDPGNVWNIERLADAYLRANDRKGAAAVAARLFSATVGADKLGSAQGTGSNSAMAMYQSTGMYGGYGGAGMGSGRTNLEHGVRFFLGHGLKAELEAVLDQQLAAQTDNALLKETAAGLFTEQLNKPERALTLMRELETAKFPLEHQTWLGQCTQQDYMRIKQYNLIATKPALRNKQLATLEAKKTEELGRDDLILLAMIRAAQGNNDKAVELLSKAAAADDQDVIALGTLVGLLTAAEKFKDAEPYARRLTVVLGERREQMHAQTIEKVRREYVRALPVELQLRVTERLLSDIADKWTIGQGWSMYEGGSAQAMGYLRARLTLATICAETERMNEARAIWRELAPKPETPDVERLTMLGDTAQLHKQEDVAFELYTQAMKAAATVAGDALLQQVYGAGGRAWYDQDASIDKAFNAVVESFSKRNGLVELYDFLRDTGQDGRARRILEQYKLSDQLKPIYEKRVAEAAVVFKASPDGALRASPAYFAQVCKLAELYDLAGDWPAAQKAYEAYLKDFPDELGLVTLLGEVAEVRLKTDEAIEWEKRAIDCKTRLSKQARAWSQRELATVPSIPRAMGERIDTYEWASRWGGSRSSYGGSSRDELERWPSLMRLAQLQLAAKNPLAAADSMQRAVADAGPRRDEVVRESLTMIEQRQLTGQMLSVLRTLAVYAPANERVQLVFAQSLEENNRKELALEVCNRLLRKGVSDLQVLAELRRHVQSLNPESAAPEATLTSLEAQHSADPANLKVRLRLAKAYYYSLDLPKAEALLAGLVKEAPNLEDAHDLLVEVYTLTDNPEKLTEALRAKIERTTDEQKRRQTRWRLADQLLASGKTEEALAIVKDLGDPRDPQSYVRIGAMLHYFGRADEALAALEEAGKSGQGARGGYSPYGASNPAFTVAQSLAMRGEFTKAADKIMGAVDEEAQKQVQYGGMGGMPGMPQERGSVFAVLEPVFALYPQLATEVTTRVEERAKTNAADPQAVKLLMSLQRSLGRSDKAEALLESLVKDDTADQGLVAQRIDLAVRRREFTRAIDMAQKFIAQAPKPQLPPGMPAQYAGYAVLQSPRTTMLCKLGDVYWDMGDKDKAFATYSQILDKKVDETKVAYAAICLMRGRTAEASALVEEGLAAQQVKSGNLLSFRAFIAVLEGKVDQAVDALELAATNAGGEQPERGMYGGGGSPAAGFTSFAQNAGMVDRVVAFVQSQIKKHPDDWTNYQTLAQLYWSNGRPSEALGVLDQAAQLPPLLQQSLQTRLNWRSSEAPAEELIPLYEKLIELADREAQPSAGRSNRYSGYGGYEDYAGPGQTYRDGLAGLLWEKGDKERAEKLWTERMNLQKATTHVRLGQLYLERQEFDRAQQSFAKALELDPESTTARSALAAEAYARGDLKAMLPLMLEVFLRSPSGEDDPYRYNRDPNSTELPRMAEWAFAIARDPGLSANLASPELAPRATDLGIMIASLTGDWATLEAQLKTKIDAGSPDPLYWRLWARVQQHKGAWAETAKALDYLRRVRLTSVAQHQDKLKLVLAGQQLKEAAAGMRQAPPAGGGQPSGGRTGGYNGYSGGYYGGGWYDGEGSSSTQLPSIYIKLGDFQRAERLYLLSSGGDGIESRLPWLASLMWEQKAKDRSLDLMRLSLALSSGESYRNGNGLLTQYALMLAEAGKNDEARSLLVRAYRWNSTADTDGGMYNYGYGYGGGYRGGDESLEKSGEQTISQSLYVTLVKSGTLEKAMGELTAELAKDPTDAQLSKLIMSLQKRQRQWVQLREGLTLRAAAPGSDKALTFERLGTALQLGQWDEALVLIAQARQESPSQKPRLAAYESFVHLMRNDNEKAVAALKPIMDAPEGDADANAASSYWVTLLSVTGMHDQLALHLEKYRKAGLLDDSGLDLLTRAMMAQHRFPEAAALATEQLWRRQTPLRSNDRWWRSIVKAASGAESQGASLAAPAGRPADAALLVLAGRGPGEGVQAFKALAAGPTPEIDALRGLVFAATLAADDKLALETNTRLVERLDGLRNSAWYTPPKQSLPWLARSMVTQNGYGSTGMAGMGSGMDQMIGQLTQTYDRSDAAVVTYSQLARAYRLLQRSLLARETNVEPLTSTVRAEVKSGSDYYSEEYGGYGGSYSQYMRRQGRGYTYGGEEESDSNSPTGDWSTQVRKALLQAHNFGPLYREYERLGGRTPSREWAARAQAAAAEGKTEEAVQWRRRWAEAQLANLCANDSPTLGGSSNSRWAWYAYYYNTGNNELATLRSALRAPSEEMTDQETAQPFYGFPEQLWEISLVDPVIEQQLLALEPQIGPGWGASRTTDLLLNYYRARNQPAKVIELVEKTGDIASIMTSPSVAPYIWACFKMRDDARLNALLDKAALADSTLKNELDAARLVMLRLKGGGTEAEAIESRLLAASIQEPPSPRRVDPALLSTSGFGATETPRMWVDTGRRRPEEEAYYQRGQLQLYPIKTALELAYTLGIQMEPKQGPGELTTGWVRSLYQAHGLYEDAARLLDEEIAATATPSDRHGLTEWKAFLLTKAGKTDLAAQTASKLVTELADEMAKQPSAETAVQLARVYASKAGGRNYAKAIDALTAGREIDPQCDRSSRLTVHCLYESGRHQEAWNLWRAVAAEGTGDAYSEMMLHEAALSAWGAGDKDTGRVLARQALHQYPMNPLAAKTRELIK